jgi:hypothetical protein
MKPRGTCSAYPSAPGRDWAEEIRQRVGAELIRAHIYPPARYFRQATPAAAPAASTNDGSEAKMAAVPCEPDFD